MAGYPFADAVGSAYARLASACGPRVQVQRQIDGGVELLLGMTVDPQFGPVVTVAAGGILVEIVSDAASFLAPVDAATAAGHLRRLRVFRLLAGARGSRAIDFLRLAEIVAAFSAGCAALAPALESLEVNPLIATPEAIIGVDALVVPRTNLREEQS